MARVGCRFGSQPLPLEANLQRVTAEAGAESLQSDHFCGADVAEADIWAEQSDQFNLLRLQRRLPDNLVKLSHSFHQLAEQIGQELAA